MFVTVEQRSNGATGNGWDRVDDDAVAVEALVATLRGVDRLIAQAVAQVQAALASGVVERVEALPTERAMSLAGGWSGGDARTLVAVAEALRRLPVTAGLFAAGKLSWGQVRAVVAHVKGLGGEGRAAVDATVGAAVERAGPGGDPDRVIEAAAQAADGWRDRLVGEREQRAVDASALWAQRAFDGGGRVYGELDPTLMAATLEAIDAAADPPCADDLDTGGSGADEDEVGGWGGWGRRLRARQRAEGLGRIAQTYLAGLRAGVVPGHRPATDGAAGGDNGCAPAAEGDGAGPATPDAAEAASGAGVGGRPEPARGARVEQSAPTGGAESSIDVAVWWARPRPRLLAVADVTNSGAHDGPSSAELLWRLAGPPLRLHHTSAAALACDATITPVLTAARRVLAVGDATSAISVKLREAVIVRDRGCRFPGCRAPVQWTDLHHVIPRERGGATSYDNLACLCRRDHLRVHRRGWQLTLEPDGGMTFRRGRRRWTSELRLPAIRPPPDP